MRVRPRPSYVLALALTAGAALAACDRAPASNGLPEWSAADHDGEKRTGPAPGARQGARTTGDAGGPSLVDLTWQKQCMSCHGPGGRGDGPEGPMVKAQDLTSEDWQKRVDDAQIASSIKNGKGRMPRFDKLPDEVVSGLVLRVRSFRAAKR